MRRLYPVLYAAAVVLLFAGIVWLAYPRLGLAFAAVLAAGVAFLQAGFWLLVSRGRRKSPSEDRIASFMQRSANARRFSIRDDATGLLNRWYLERRISEEAVRSKRYGYSMAVLVIKAAVPGLSSLSRDEWQEQSSEAAQRCIAALRNIDLCAVLAPFEFVICLPQCDRDGAEIVARRLAAQLAEYQCTAGVCILPADDCEPDEAIRAARARYEPVPPAKPAPFARPAI